MAPTDGWDESESSWSRTTAAGSGSGYLTDERPGDAEIDIDDATEATGLLGAGAHSNGTHDGTDARGREGSWTGDAEFAGLPWWKRPTVCLGCDQGWQH